MLWFSFHGPRWWRRRRIRQHLVDAQAFSESEIDLAIIHDRHASNQDLAEEIMLTQQERARDARRGRGMPAG